MSIHLEQAGEQLEDVTATTGIHHGEITRQTGSFYDKWTACAETIRNKAIMNIMDWNGISILILP